ncbi:MAG: head-tail connector protein [Marinibacterium sp.]|nr:head-tail connector protein [Marinibacterium sp.]
MVLTELTQVPDADLPVAEFRAHLRLGTGFGEDTLQDAVLTGFLRAAMAAVEGQIGKVLIARDYEWVLSAWRGTEAEVFPVAPVLAVAEVSVADRAGAETVIAQDRYALKQDAHRPELRATGGALPTIPLLGSVRVQFTAGLAPEWGGLPADLAQAVLMLAGYYYENRAESMSGGHWMPYGVTSLLRRYRPMRLTAGAGQ